MLARCASALALAVGVLAGAGGEAAPASAGPVSQPRRPERVWVDPAHDVAPDARFQARVSNLLYVNRCAGGCILTPGANDARTDRSSMIGDTTMLSEFALGDDVYDDVIECLRDVYGPYDVEIVTRDPGPETFHHEAIMAGRPEEAGFASNIAGVAPASCEPLNNVISFSFSNFDDNDAEQLCWTVAQESAHSFGLPNHVFDCHDPMTYLEGPCGRKYFRNRAIECGEFETGPCDCDVSSQNSHAELLATFGEGRRPPPPEVSLLDPAPETSVGDNFGILFTAVDPRLVDRVELLLNGSRYMTMPGHDYDRRADEYRVEAPNLPDGYIDVEIRAFNDVNEEAGRATATVLKGEPCTSADQCFELMACEDGRCAYPAPAGAPGDRCDYDQYCVEGSCAELGGERRCALGCDPEEPRSCSFAFDCRPPGVCWPAEGPGGCASAGGGRGGGHFPLVALGLWAGAVLMARRGRRDRQRGRAR